MKNKSVIEEADDVRRAVEMVQLGARMQMLEVETRLSREKLLRIYKGSPRCLAPQGHAAVLHRLVHDLAAERAFLAVHEPVPLLHRPGRRARPGRDPQVLSPLSRPHRDRRDRARAEPHARVDPGALLRRRPAADGRVYPLRRRVRRPRPRSGARLRVRPVQHALARRLRAPQDHHPQGGRAHAQDDGRQPQGGRRSDPGGPSGPHAEFHMGRAGNRRPMSRPRTAWRRAPARSSSSRRRRYPLREPCRSVRGAAKRFGVSPCS